MAVREWDPAGASDQELDAIVATLNVVFAADLPADPPWQTGAMRAYLTETMPGERRVCWVATEEDPAPGRPPRVIGHANLLLMADLGVLEVLVHPPARQQGCGHALVAAAARRAYEEGIASIGVEAVGGTTAAKFWESLGFRCGYVEMRCILSLAEVDWPAAERMAGEIPAGYQVECHADGLPERLREPYAAAKASRRDNGGGGAGPTELELRPSSYDAQRLADSLDTLSRRGMKPYLVLARHEESGAVAALTELVVPAQHPGRGDQYDTIVVPRHRGRRLGHAVKARMLQELRTAEPQLTEIQTWNALENDPIAEVNQALGFRPDREWREYEADVLDLIHGLGTK